MPKKFASRKEANQYMRDWRNRNYEREKLKWKQYYEANRERIRKAQNEYRKQNWSEIYQRYQAGYYQENKKRLQRYRNGWARRKIKTDLHFRILTNLRQRLKSAIKGKHQRKAPKTTELIGCSAQFLRGYLEAQFEPWMSWENYGEWEIDHILPCSKFDLTDVRQQLVCFHYTNLQPLRKRENQSKGNKIIQFKAA